MPEWWEAAPLVESKKPPVASGYEDATRYDTRLNSAEEGQFNAWKKSYAPNDSGADYDLRGAFKAGLKPDPQNGHWPDTFKKPNHPTFSVESQYAKMAPGKAGRWDGERYIAPANSSENWWESAPLAQAPTKKQPGFASRFLDNTIKPIEAVSDSIQSAMRSQNPIGELASAAGRGVKNVVDAVANTRSAKAGNPIGGIGEVLAEPVVTVGKDLLEGNLPAAAGGAAGLALPFLPKGVRAAGGLRPAPGVPSAVGRGIVEGAKESALPILKDFELNRPVRSGVEALERTLGKIREELAKNKTTQAVEANRQANPGRAVEPVAGEPLPDATPIMPWAHQNMASQYGVLPSGRKVGPAFQQPMTKASRVAAARVDVPAEALPDATPIVGDLPSGRRPMTAMEREAKYAKPLPKPDNAARVSTKPEPGSPMERLSPQQLANAEALAAEYGTQTSAEATTPQFEAGARAKKVWGMSDLLAEHGITAEDAALMTKDMWEQATAAINKANHLDWQGAKAGTKRPNTHAVPGAQSRAEIVNELREIEARKAATQ